MSSARTGSPTCRLHAGGPRLSPSSGPPRVPRSSRRSRRRRGSTPPPGYAGRRTRRPRQDAEDRDERTQFQRIHVLAVACDVPVAGEHQPCSRGCQVEHRLGRLARAAQDPQGTRTVSTASQPATARSSVGTATTVFRPGARPASACSSRGSTRTTGRHPRPRSPAPARACADEFAPRGLELIIDGLEGLFAAVAGRSPPLTRFALARSGSPRVPVRVHPRISSRSLLLNPHREDGLHHDVQPPPSSGAPRCRLLSRSSNWMISVRARSGSGWSPPASATRTRS
ncbi:hypothetical protein SHIRM173S_03929 [Streptomyces hirsutus]